MSASAKTCRCFILTPQDFLLLEAWERCGSARNEGLWVLVERTQRCDGELKGDWGEGTPRYHSTSGLLPACPCHNPWNLGMLGYMAKRS